VITYIMKKLTYPRRQSPPKIEPAKCMICGSTKSRVVYRKDGFKKVTALDFSVTKSIFKKGEVSRCEQCGLYFATNRLFSKNYYEEVIDDLYENDRTQRLVEAQILYHNLREDLSHLDQKVRILDIGCLTGIFLEYLRKSVERTYLCCGVEPSSWAVRLCRQKKLRVKQGFFENQTYPKNYFHLITLLDCLEHVDDPLTILQSVHRILKKDGLLVLTTPNIASIYHKIFRRNYWFIEIMHTFYFSPATIQAILNKAGFITVSIEKHYKYLSAGYLLERIRGAGLPLGTWATLLAPIRFLHKMNLILYLGQMLVVAKKK